MSLRVAWLGPTPADGGGVPYMATTLLRALNGLGVDVDCFVVGSLSAVPESLRRLEGLSFVAHESGWAYDRWYSSHDLTKVVTGQVSRAVVQHRIVEDVIGRHEARPYDAVYQFSQLELLALRRSRGLLPPLIVHPETHAAGELRWHRLERALAKRCETDLRHYAARTTLHTRSLVQRRDARTVDRLVCPSRAFADELRRDYALPVERLRVVPNPIDLDRFLPDPDRCASGASGPIEILFVSRLAVRKGAELVVALSHRLSDLAGRVRIRVVGDKSLWSDYRCLMRDLNPAVASYAGGVWGRDAPALYAGSHLVVQPSHYEPFALTVGEALASGLPVVVSEAVGAGEDVDPRCCRRFPTGDVAAFESAVRQLVDELRDGGGEAIARLARAEAERRFAPAKVAAEIATVIGEVGSAA